MSEADDGLIGREIGGRYRILSCLGVGGMATAYLATDVRVSRSVVVKIPHPELLAQPGFRERFQREVRSLTELQHPGIVPLYDCGEEPGGVPYCVVRYLPGGDLADRIEAAGGRLTATELSRWLPRVAETLDFIHQAGVLHRDVTPVNILFDEVGNVFLSDFGVAAILQATDDPSASDDPRLTAEGAFVGAAIYAPPEAVFRDLTPAYDQYSLALVLYHTLCGYLPYPQIETRALMMAKNGEPPAPLDQRGVPLPPAAVDAVMRGLSRDPAARFPSCRDLALAFTDGGDAIDTQAIVVPNLPPLQQRGIRAAILAALGLLAAMGLGFWLLRGGAPDHEGRIAAAAAPENQVGERPQAQAARAPEVAEPGVMAGTFQAGTTEEELADALRLCRGYASDCPASLYADEELRVVAVGPFELDRTEVTNRDFAAFVAGTGYTTTAEERGTSRDGPFAERGLGWRRPAGPRSSHQDLPDHPVVHVSAPDAEAYCAYARGRLPTEDEWEFAARSDDRRLFPWGPQWDANAASWASSTTARARPVGTFPPGPFGHRDLTGNVWEWTATHQGSQRILKGGSWMEINPADLRSAARLLSDPTDRSSDIGFRCARDVTR